MRLFAQIAIYEMVFEHEVVLEKVRNRRAGIKRSARWQRATQQYVEQLKDALAQLETDIAVGFGPQVDGGITLLLPTGPVMVSSLDFTTAHGLESRIAESYCQFTDCEFLETDAASAAPRSRAVWKFSQRSRYVLETDAGLGFEFTDLGGRKAKERVVATIAEELRTFEDVVRRTFADGARVDWRQFEARTGPVGSGAVYLGPPGERVKVCLPYLARVEPLVTQLPFWLRGRLRGDASAYLISQADQVLLPLLKSR